MPSSRLRLLLPLSLALLAACAQKPVSSLIVQQNQKDKCPLNLRSGQQLMLTLSSNPTTGYRWVVKDAAPTVLLSLGPEVYTNPEDAGLVGSAGQSTWRFKATHSGDGRLLLLYQRPWEIGVEPAETFDCQITVK